MGMAMRGPSVRVGVWRRGQRENNAKKQHFGLFCDDKQITVFC